MLQQQTEVHRLSNGLTLVAEIMPQVSSAAFAFLTPAGVGRDPENLTGTASILSDLTFRGAGDYDNRGLNEALDNLGLSRGSSTSSLHTRYSGALVGDKLIDVLEIYADVLCRPQLANDQFEMCKMLAIQNIESLEDDPRQKISLLTQEQYLPFPFGRPSIGKMEDVQKCSLSDVRAYWQKWYTPQTTILAVAGNIDFDALRDRVESLFGDWQGDGVEALPQGQRDYGYVHHHNDGAQVHIGVMYDSVHFCDEDYYKALGASSILSGGMGSRLFTEVREKRALCYAVGASHQIIGPFGAVRCYLGSSPEQAQEGLDVLLAELLKLSEGVSQDELDRAKVGLRASLIMQGESSGARALHCASDFYHLERVRSLSEIEDAINDLTVDDILDYATTYKPQNFSITTLGPTELKVNV